MTTTNETITVLAVDDDPKILRLIANHLGGVGFKVLLALNGNEAIHQASLHHPQAIVLDLIMPQMDGFETLTRVREWYTDPVIILSATDQEEEKIRALDLGADDYVTKPFGPGELAARIRAAVRRVDRLGDTTDVKEPKINAGTFEIDLAARVVYKNDQEIRLTRTEYDLLRVLVINAGKVMTHQQLLQAVWGPEYGEETEYLRTFVKQIRRKLENDPTRPKQILTEPGVGYRLLIST
jgi:two-component system KDP operon response regulator KdpE|tara:strand:+ start:380 stop:1093 length:714 start_codon:yes stop_codon:yes gene_type:complete